MLHRRTASLPWDDLDAALCGEDAGPVWSTMTVSGPRRSASRTGPVVLQWVVTVECGSARDDE